MIERRDVFQAIADPTRRMIIQKLSAGALNIGQIVEDSGITRQGIAKHLKVLNECGMITVTQKGREQFCEARITQLDEVVDWVDESRKLWTQQFEKLDKYLEETKKINVKTKDKELLISHLFNAPIAKVFDAWTDPEKLKRWYAPDGCTITYKSIEVKPGGTFHYYMYDPQHGGCWIKGAYLEVLPPEKLVFTMHFSNENGDAADGLTAGMSAQWPGEIRTTVTFEALGDQTKATVHETVSEEKAKKTGAYDGWMKMFNKLNNLLTNNK